MQLMQIKVATIITECDCAMCDSIEYECGRKFGCAYQGDAFEGQIAEFVDDQQLGFCEEGELLGELAIEPGAGECAEQRSGAGEEHRVARLDGGAADRDGEVSFADAGRTKEQHIVGLCDEAAGGQLPDEALVNRGL
jgi:hypothetical protein